MRPPVARVVLLGASNVARGIATIIDVARESLGGPLDVIVAMGHGRSYGLTTSIPFRTLPSILDSGLWEAMKSRLPLPTWTVLTDIGNDLIYGCEPAQVTDWIDDALGRLRSIASQHETPQQLLLTGLPLASISKLGPARFLAFRSALFPKSKLQLDHARRHAHELDDAVQQLAAQHGAEFLTPRGEWYGFDPIHIGVRVQRVAWREFFFALTKKYFSPASALYSPWREWRRLMMIRPEQSHVFFRARSVSQPAVVLSDGTTVSFY